MRGAALHLRRLSLLACLFSPERRMRVPHARDATCACPSTPPTSLAIPTPGRATVLPSSFCAHPMQQPGSLSLPTLPFLPL